MLENEMKISLTLVAFDKMSKVLRDAVHKSNEEFDKIALNYFDKTYPQRKEQRQTIINALLNYHV